MSTSDDFANKCPVNATAHANPASQRPRFMKANIQITIRNVGMLSIPKTCRSGGLKAELQVCRWIQEILRHRNLGESSDFRSRNGRCISHKNRPLAVAKSSSKAIELWNTSINTMFWGDLHPALPSYFDAPGFLTQPFPLQSHWMTILGRWNPTKSPFLVAGKSRWENGEIPWKIPRCLTRFSRYPVLSLPADSSIESRQRFGLQHLPQSRGPLQHGKDLGSSEVHINNGRRME